MNCPSEETGLNNNEVKRSHRKISFRFQLAYGVGHVLNDVCSSIWFTYLLVFLHLVLEFENWQAGFMLLIGQVADAVANPFVGYQSDQPDSGWFCKYGKRKIWHLLGTICILTTFPFVFLPCVSCTESHKWAQVFYFSVFITIFQFGWAAVQISHLALIPELTPDENERTKLTATRYCFTVISNLSVYLITWSILGVDDDDDENLIGPSDAPKFQNIVWGGLSIGILCTLIFHYFVKENDSTEINQNDVNPTSRSRSIAEIFSNFEHYQVAVIYMSTMLFVNLNQVFIPLYLYETLNMAPSALALIPLITYMGSFGASMVVEKINKYLGRKGAYLTGAAFGFAACAWILIRSSLPEYVITEIYVVAVLIGVASAIMLVTNLGITADLIGNETGSGAFIYSIMTFTDKMANGIAVFVIQDFHKNYPSHEYYKNVIVFVCGGAVLLATTSVISLRKRTSTRAKGEYIEIA